MLYYLVIVLNNTTLFCVMLNLYVFVIPTIFILQYVCVLYTYTHIVKYIIYIQYRFIIVYNKSYITLFISSSYLFCLMLQLV